MGSITRELALKEFPSMSQEQAAQQRRSFAFGNVSMSNPDVTREIVRLMLTEFGHDPDDLISNAGHTVLDGWMEKVRNEVA